MRVFLAILALSLAFSALAQTPRQIDVGFNVVLGNADLAVYSTWLSGPAVRYKILRDNWCGAWRYMGVREEEMRDKAIAWTAMSSDHRFLLVVGDREWFLGDKARILWAKAVAEWDRPVLQRAIDEALSLTKGIPRGQLMIEVGNSADETGWETPFEWNPYRVSNVARSTIRKRWEAWGKMVYDAFPGAQVINRNASTRTSHVYNYSDSQVIKTWSGKISPLVTECGVTGSRIHDPLAWVSLLSWLGRAGATMIVVHAPILDDFGKQRYFLDNPDKLWRIYNYDEALEILKFEKREWPHDYGAFLEPSVLSIWQAWLGN